MGHFIRIAAANSSSEDKNKADVVCNGKNDENTINEHIKKLTRGGTIQLLDGDYYIDSFENEDNTAIYFGYNDGEARVINFIGDTENKSYNTHFGSVIHVTRSALESLKDGAEGHVFFGTAKRPESRGDFFTMTYINNVNFNNFYVILYDASKPITGLDFSHFGSAEVTQVGVYTEQYFNDRFLHLKPQTPCKGCVGFRSCHGSNDEMARVGFDVANVGGLYAGFEFIGEDHAILQDCTAARCCYGYVFNHSAKTITSINCADEGNTHLPAFRGRGQITIIDFNIERFNANYIADDPEGDTEAHATEEISGGWHGLISYTMQGDAFGLKSFWKEGHGRNFKTINLYNDKNSRPENPEFLETYFDKSTNRTITWTGDMWVDAMGNRAD